jgi:small-conductance mechanosensitive channel
MDVTRRFRVRASLRLAVVGALLLAAVLSQQVAAQDLSQILSTATPGQAAVLRYSNRPITALRATILGRSPEERAAGAVVILDRLVDDGSPGSVSTRLLVGAAIVSVGSRDVFAIIPLDVDELAGETLSGKAADAVSHLQQALDEAIELRTPRRILTSTALALLATAIFGLLLWLSRRLYRVVVVFLAASAERRLQRLSVGAELVRASHAPDVVRHAVRTGFAALWLLLGYSWLTFTLRRFPYTRPWGESLRAFLLDRFAFLGLEILGGIPDLFMVLLVLLATRFVVKLCHALFDATEQGRLTIPYVYPETAQPTRRLVSAVVWLLGIVLAYPYLPGSNSDAFKGVSVFLGIVLSLGSSGIVNQMMSGLTITYSRAVRQGDFVRIGDVEGTVTHLGSLSTKARGQRGRVRADFPDDRLRHPVAPGSRAAAVGRVEDPGRQARSETGGAPDRSPGFLRAVHPAGLPRDAAAPRSHTQRASFQHPGRVQRVRRPDHVAQLRGGSDRPQGRPGRPVVLRPGRTSGIRVRAPPVRSTAAAMTPI